MSRAKTVIVLCAGLVFLALTAVFALSVTAASSDAGKIVLSVMGTNAKGADTLANRNSEYMWMRNVSAEPVDVMDWRLTDTTGGANVTTFDGDWADHCDCGMSPVDGKLMLPPGHSLVVYSGEGHDTNPTNNVHAYYKDWHHMWNNTSGETVKVLDKDGLLVDGYAYDAYGINPLRF